MTVGLGTGRAATAFIDALAEHCQRHAWHIRTVASSDASARHAAERGITTCELASIQRIDVTVDGADEVDLLGNVVKGLGGALLRERVLAECSDLWVLCVGRDKRVARVGERRVLPVEVVPFAVPFCQRKIESLGYPNQLRQHDASPFVTDNGNHILDCRIEPTMDPLAIYSQIRPLPGVVETGLFLGFAPVVITQDGDHVTVEGCG
jgi:ribose 5-phosphate isomerase A